MWKKPKIKQLDIDKYILSLVKEKSKVLTKLENTKLQQLEFHKANINVNISLHAQHKIEQQYAIYQKSIDDLTYLYSILSYKISDYKIM